MQKSNEELAICCKRGRASHAGGAMERWRAWRGTGYKAVSYQVSGSVQNTGRKTQGFDVQLFGNGGSGGGKNMIACVGCKFSTFFCIYLKKELWDCLGYRTAAQRYDAQPAAPKPGTANNRGKKV